MLLHIYQGSLICLGLCAYNEMSPLFLQDTTFGFIKDKKKNEHLKNFCSKYFSIACFFFCILWQSMDLLKVKGGKTSNLHYSALFFKYIDLSVNVDE